jgi:hypothetical protein
MRIRAMQTVQISIGEIIEATYEELMETYGDKELALAAAQAVGDELLARFAAKPRLIRRDLVPPGLHLLSAVVTR